MLIHFCRFNNWLYKHYVPLLSDFIWNLQCLLFNSTISASCTIGKGTMLAYGGIGTVIHARAVIGSNCMIGQNITIGGKSGWYEVPIIGDNVHISAGARILGPVRIGNNVIIGANAVVVKDVPDNCIVAGIPAKIIKENISMEDYEGAKALKYRGNNGWPITPNV